IENATGADPSLDQAIAATFDRSSPDGRALDYTASVDRCVELVHQLLPGWAWHVGFGPNGIVPYATLHDDVHRTEAKAPTVPLALLKAVTKARISIDA
ncbi:MAG: hypothetical protein AAFY56_10380, partial [Pseudomonadota bacterium]